MALTHLPLAVITEDHLNRLVAAQAAESLHIEYKRETYGGSDEHRREFLADVSSFANAAGGDLLIGIAARKGVPIGLHAFVGEADDELLRLQQLARDGLHPRVAKLEPHAVPLAGGGRVLILRIPQSYNPPHRVIFKNSGRFWARSSAGKYEPNVEELRRIFTEAPLLAERIRAFRTERIVKVAAGETPVTLAGTCLMVLHVVPYSAFDRSVQLPIADLEAQALAFAPLGRPRGTHHYVNFDGFAVLSNANEHQEQQHHSYAQVFRTGIVEAVSTINRTEEAIPAGNIDKYAVANAKRCVEALARANVNPPFAVLVSLVGVKGKALASGIDGLDAPFGEPRLRQDQIHFAEVVLEDVPASHGATALLLRPLLEQVWNTAGFSSVQTLNAAGSWLYGD